MRWPLRNQILTRMVFLLVITITCLTFANIRSAIAVNREVERDRVRRLVELTKTTRFPLTAPVLENMKLLSGSEFVLVEGRRNEVARTSQAPSIPTEGWPAESAFEKESTPMRFVSEGNSYMHVAVTGLESRSRTARDRVLHIFVPSQSRESIWWQASKSPLLIATLILPMALLLSLALASQVTRPLAKLENQVQRIAEGEIQRIPEVQRNDEIRDLNVSINEMADKLQDHDEQVQKNERLRSMLQFGNGIAHHLRNSATGCKMAVELLASNQDEISTSENYQVAIRQLDLMDNYIKKFLLLSKSSSIKESEDVHWLDMESVLNDVVSMIRPSAEHLGVHLSIETDCDDSRINLSKEDGQQLMMNLIANALRAASETNASATDRRQPTVVVNLLVERGVAHFSVVDNGPGPPLQIADTLFDPFVTGSSEGTGLGLSLVKEIASRSGGTVNWSRENEVTCFRFETGPHPSASPN